MPYEFRFRGQAESFRNNDMHGVHDHASYVFERIILPWLSRGPAAGGPNLPGIVSDLESYRQVWALMNPADHGLDDEAHREQDGQFRLLKNSGTWKLLTVSHAVVNPQGRVFFTMGFDLMGQNPANLEEIAHATRDIWDDFLIANFRPAPPAAGNPGP